MLSDDTAIIRESLEKHNQTFSSLLKLIPAKYYIVKDQDEEPSNKYQKNSKTQKMPRQALKEASKKAKKAKLDPANQKTILDFQEEDAARRAAEKQAAVQAGKVKDVKGKGKRKAEEMESDEESESEMEFTGFSRAGPSRPLKSSLPPPSAPAVPMPDSGSITALRSKLHDRISALQRKSGRRKEGDESGEGDLEGMPSTKDELLEMRRAKRGEMRDRRRKEVKERKAKERAALNTKEKGKGANSAPASTKLLVPNPLSNPPPEQNIAFSALAFPQPSSSKAARKHATSSDPTAALAKLSAKAAALEKLSPEDRAKREEKERYEKAEIRVEGGKVRDDMGRLKKAAKRKEKEKDRSKKDWGKRKQEIAISTAAKQKKRNDNILARNERRKDKKKGIKPKIGKARPGFEGKPMPGFARKKGKSTAKN